MNTELFQETSSATITTSSIENDYTWEINPDDPETVTITSFKGSVQRRTAPDGSLLPLSSLNIPYKLDNKITTIIGPGAFQGNQNIDRVVIHSEILSIEAGAFADCSQLFYLAFYNDCKLQYIKEAAFINTQINNPIIPASVVKIEADAFNTKKLKTVTFLGDCPVFAVDSFNSQTDNNNLNKKISILYFSDSIGFDNNLSDTKFLYVANYRMKLPLENTPIPPQQPTIYRYINYVLLSLLLIGLIYFIYNRFKKNDKYNVNIDDTLGTISPLTPLGNTPSGNTPSGNTPPAYNI